MIVVDTHALLWLTQEPKQLSALASRTLIEARAEGDLAIADITLSEIAYAVTRGRVTIDSPLPVYLRFVESLFRVLPIDSQIAERAMYFQPSYPKDPADRLIGATAIVHHARLVTKDRRIHASKEVECIW